MAQSRVPWFYRRLGVPDTLEGRFELLVLHMFIALERLRLGDRCEPIAQELVDGFFTDMDVIHREIGVSDLRVPKKMRRTAAIFYERLDRYAEAFAKERDAAVDAHLNAHVYAGGGDPTRVAALRAYATRARGALSDQAEAALGMGEIRFPDPSEAEIETAEAS